MIISNHLITGKTKFIAHIGFPTKSFTAPKILWVKKNEPEVFAKIDKAENIFIMKVNY